MPGRQIFSNSRTLRKLKKKNNPTSKENSVKQSEGKSGRFQFAIPHGRELLLGASPQDEHSLPTPYIP